MLKSFTNYRSNNRKWKQITANLHARQLLLLKLHKHWIRSRYCQRRRCAPGDLCGHHLTLKPRSHHCPHLKQSATSPPNKQDGAQFIMHSNNDAGVTLHSPFHYVQIKTLWAHSKSLKLSKFLQSCTRSLYAYRAAWSCQPRLTVAQIIQEKY